MAIYGYARVSTKKQDPERQIREIRRIEPEARFFCDVYTGTVMDSRKDWNRLMKLVKANDTIIFDGVSRMSRNANEGVTTYKELYYKGVNLVFIKDPHINTDVYREALQAKVPMTGTDADIILRAINEYLMCVAEKQIRIAFEQSEAEVLRLRQRTSEGILTAKLSGKTIGRTKGRTYETEKSKYCKKKILAYSKDFNGEMKDVDLIRMLGITRETYYRYKKQLHDKETTEETNAQENPAGE